MLGVVMMVMVVIVGVVIPPPVLLLIIILLLTLGSALHRMGVSVRVSVCVGQQGRRGGQLFQGGMRGLDSDCSLSQQVNCMWQGRQDELKALLQRTVSFFLFDSIFNKLQSLTSILSEP